MNKYSIGGIVALFLLLLSATFAQAVGGVVGTFQSKTDTTLTVSQNGTSVIVPLSAATQFVGRSNSILQKTDINQGDLVIAPSSSASASTVYIYKPNQKGEQIAVYGTLTGVNGQILAVLQDGTKDTYYTVVLSSTTIVKNSDQQVVSLTKDDISKKVLIIGRIDQEHILAGVSVLLQAQ
jgi:hypothetical protein